jgi:hypothetical protein
MTARARVRGWSVTLVLGALIAAVLLAVLR